MKKFLHFLLTAAAAAVVIAGCEDKIVSGVLPELEFESTEINAPGGGGEVSVAYRILNPVAAGRLAADPSEDWMENFNAVSDTLITFDVLPNDTDALREGKVTFTYIYGEDGSVPAEVTVRQAPASEEPGDGPSVEADPVPEIPAAGGSVTITYSIVNPVEGGKVSASSEAEWLTDFVSGEEGSVSFNAGANDGETREAAVVLTYEWADGKVETEVPVSQAAGTSGQYDHEYVMEYVHLASFGNIGNNGEADYALYISDEPFVDGMPKPNSTSYFSLDVWTPAVTDDSELPPAGEYPMGEYGATEAMTMGMDYTQAMLQDLQNIFSFVDGLLTIGYEGDDMDVDVVLTAEDGTTFHAVYSGPAPVLGSDR